MRPGPPPLVDSHAHLDSPEYRGRLAAVIERARDAGVSNILTVGTSLASTLEALEISRRHPHVAAAAGVHPNYVAEKGGEFDAVADLFESRPLVAVGETGLDFYRDYTPPDLQRQAFRRHIELALARDLPLIVHVRDAYDETLEVIDEFDPPPRGVFHCFSGDADFAREVLERGFFMSFAGQVTFKNADDLRQVAAETPLGRLLVETDCPYLAPVPRRGKTNEPAFVRFTAEALAECTGEDFEDLARATTANAWRLFGIGDRPPHGAVAYPLKGNLYLNVTNRCPNRCPWCVRFRSPWLAGWHLALDEEPSFEEIIDAIGDPSHYAEVVFCGYGEPTERLDIVKRVGKYLKDRGARVRLDTNGLGSLSAGRDIVPELAASVDSVSVSLNAASASQYMEICRPTDGEKAWDAVLDFIAKVRAAFGEVTVTAVDLPGVEGETVRTLAEHLGAGFRLRRYGRFG